MPGDEKVVGGLGLALLYICKFSEDKKVKGIGPRNFGSWDSGDSTHLNFIYRVLLKQP